MRFFLGLKHIYRRMLHIFSFCPKTSSSDTTLLFFPFFVILSQIPKQTFELDTFFFIPHLWYFFVYIVDNFVYNSVFHGFLHFFLGITLRFFHIQETLPFFGSLPKRCSFVQFAQKLPCQYYFEFFLFSLFSKNFTKETDKVPDALMS